MEKVIEVKALSKSFKEYKVLDRVSFDVVRGKICGIVGRNGSGKSVLFKCICGFCRGDEGHIFVRGKEIGKDIDVIEDAGVIIETPGFLPSFNGYRNLKFLMDLNQKSSKENILNAMERVGLDPKSKKKVGNYSLGMKQRLAIAQALMESQDILILDEPMNGLDKMGVADIRKILQELKNDGKVILISSHYQEDIDILCDEVYEMEKGVLTKVRGDDVNELCENSI